MSNEIITKKRNKKKTAIMKISLVRTFSSQAAWKKEIMFLLFWDKSLKNKYIYTKENNKRSLPTYSFYILNKIK